MKKLVTLLLALVMCLSLVACGGVDKQPAIDAFNSAVAKYDAMAMEMNENIDLYPQELVDVLVEMSDALLEHKAILEGDQELTQEDVDMLIGVFNEVEAWVDETVPQLDEYLELNALALEDVAEAQVIETLPAIRRVTGTGLPGISTGTWTANDWGRFTCCIDTTRGPWLLLKTEGGKLFLFGGGDADISAVMAALEG